MENVKTVDARGLSCPQPVLMTREILDTLDAGTVAVLVDSGTARDNVVRAAQRVGWRLAALEPLDDGLRLVLEK